MGHEVSILSPPLVAFWFTLPPWGKVTRRPLAAKFLSKNQEGENHSMNIMGELALIFGICLVGEGVAALLPVAFRPASSAWCC